MNGETLSNQWICSLTGQKWVALAHQGGTDAQRWWLAGSCIDWWTSVSVGEKYGRHVQYLCMYLCVGEEEGHTYIFSMQHLHIMCVRLIL